MESGFGQNCSLSHSIIDLEYFTFWNILYWKNACLWSIWNDTFCWVSIYKYSLEKIKSKENVCWCGSSSLKSLGIHTVSLEFFKWWFFFNIVFKIWLKGHMWFLLWKWISSYWKMEMLEIMGSCAYCKIVSLSRVPSVMKASLFIFADFSAYPICHIILQIMSLPWGEMSFLSQKMCEKWLFKNFDELEVHITAHQVFLL